MLNEIDKLKTLIDSKRPLPRATILSYMKDIALRWTFNSNAIEGNSLTLNETKVVLEGITIGGKALREHFEVINHSEAIDYLTDIVKKEVLITETIIKQLHYLILKNINNREAGKYRDVNVRITGASHIPPNPLQLKDLINDILDYHLKSNIHPVEKAAIFHADFVGIHPFIDGNGRTGRLLLNLMLMIEGYQPIIIDVKDRARYYDALDKACSIEDYSDIIKLVSECQIKTLNEYLTLF